LRRFFEEVNEVAQKQHFRMPEDKIGANLQFSSNKNMPLTPKEQVFKETKKFMIKVAQIPAFNHSRLFKFKILL